MKFIVNDNCIGCGMCADVCPEIFHITDEGTAQAVENDVDEANVLSGKEAMDGCPASAIDEA